LLRLSEVGLSHKGSCWLGTELAQRRTVPQGFKNEKPRAKRRVLGERLQQLSCGHAHGVAVERALDGKRHMAFCQCKQGVVFADADIGARVELCATLTHDDRTWGHQLATIHLHTEHFGLGIAPISRRAAAFFVCHDSCSLCGNRANQQFSELLTVTLTFLIVLATAHFENADLVVLAMRHDRDTHCCAGHQGCANLQLCAATDCQNLVEHNFLAYIRSNLFYFNFFASSNSVLFATSFYDRVHNNLLKMLRERIFAEPWIITQANKKANQVPKPAQSSECRRGGLSIIRATNRAQVLHATHTLKPSPLAIIAQDMREVDQVIAQRLDSGVPLVGQVSRYIISAGGKRLRPVLLLMICGALGFKGAQRFNLAAVVEFIHTATLLHDDVVDDSALRRGNATANETFGNPASVLVGDFLYSRAFQMMVDAQSMRIMEVLANATNIIAEGEVMQLMNMHNAALDETGYLQVIRSKTAKLFEASARVGAILAGADAKTEAACAEYGQALGTAFQVIDDVLDYTGDAAVMGKNLGDDLREGKTTLPLIAAMQRGDATQRELIQTAIETGNIDLIDQVVAIVSTTGALDVAREAAASEARRAIAAAGQLPDNEHSRGLIQLAAQLLERQS